MRIMAVDNERWALGQLADTVQEVVPGADVSSFAKPLEALEYAQGHAVDVAFLDVRMPLLDGLGLAVKLKELYPLINIIFVTGYGEYIKDAMKLHASGFVDKPVTVAAVREQMDNLLHKDTGAQPKPVDELGPYSFDHVAQRVYHNGEDTLLKPREYHLFFLFASNPGVYFAPEELYQKIWGDEPVGDVPTVKVHVSSLRKKLKMEDNSSPNIKVQRSLGYYLYLAP